MKNTMIHTPEGVRDIYGKEYAAKLWIEKKLHEKLTLYGYRDIQTPTFEFFDIFSNEVGTTPSKELYKFFDKEGNTLALRPDFTPSIARCAAKYFVDDSMPIRLCYEGNSFTNTSNLQGKLKETTQMGAEQIDSCNHVEADAEMICLIIDSLKAVGFREFQLTVGEIDYFKGICEELQLSDEDTDELRSYISVKNFFGAEEFLNTLNISQKYVKMLLNVSEISSIDELREIKNTIDNQKSVLAIERLEEIYNVVERYGMEKYISFDLGMLSKFHYYTGVIFKAYTYGVGDAVVKGGRYDNLLGRFGKDSAAVGFVFLVDDIMSALAAQKLLPKMENRETWIVYDHLHRQEAIERLAQLREAGNIAAGIVYNPEKTKEDYLDYAKRNDIETIEFLL